MSKTCKLDYLFFRIRGRLVKVDPDIYYKIRNPGHELPYRKYNGDILGMRICDGYPVIVCGKEKPQKYIPLSRFVMNAKQGEIVDHINGDPLDNRRCNLRIVTPRQNSLNRKSKTSTGFIGVTINRTKGRTYCVGRFWLSTGKGPAFHLPDSPENRIIAAFAHDKFVLQAGDEEYAPLNFPCFKFEPFRSFLLAEDLKNYKRPVIASEPVLSNVEGAKQSKLLN
jgi:hypothetical protein